MRVTYSKTSELPEVGDGFETQLLDFKVTSKGVAPFHMAKDVAALANHLGGSIIVGGDEVSGVLVRYVPLDSLDAAAQQRAYEEAVRDLCSPVPSYGIERIAIDGGLVLVINVEPAVNGLVGVKVTSVKEDVRWGGHAWIFPMRTGSQTRCVQPSELPMFTSGHVRRMAILLSGIPSADTIVIAEQNKYEGGRIEHPYKVINVDEAGNCVSVQMLDHHDRPLFTKPLDRFETVWREAPGQWRAFMGMLR